MKKIVPRLLYYMLAPLAVLLMAFGLWLTVQAGRSNDNFGKGVGQVLRGVAQARQMRLTPNSDPRQALNELITYLSQGAREKIQIMAGVDALRENNKALVNAWGGQTRFYLYPQAMALRVEAEMDAASCKHYASFFIRDAVPLGVQRVDSLLDQTTGIWRLVYDSAKTVQDQYLEQAIKAGCGSGEGKTVSVTFSLK